MGRMSEALTLGLRYCTCMYKARKSGGWSSVCVCVGWGRQMQRVISSE